MDTLTFGKQVREALTAGSTVSANRLEQNIGSIVQMLLADEPLEKLTGEDLLRTVTNLLDREHRYFERAAEGVKRSEERAARAANSISRDLREIQGLKAEVERAQERLGDISAEYDKIFEQVCLMKREPNGETTSLNPQPNHFTCRLCGCSMGKIQPDASSSWVWMKPRFCPMCGAEVIA